MGVTTNLINKPFNPRAQDQSPKGYNRAALYSGKALDFDGANDYANIDYSDTIGSVWTWSSIIEFDVISGYQVIFGGSNSSSNITIYLKDNQINFYTDGDNLNTAFDFETGEKYHIACSQSGDTISVYVNGQAAGSVSLTATLNSTSNTYTLCKNPASSYQFLNAKISGLKLFNTALTAAQVADLYNNPEKVVPTGVDNTALKLWLPMMEGAGTTAINGAPDALGSEEVTNGDFATDSDWTKGTGWSISGGLASSDGSQSATSGLTSATISGLNNKGSLLLEVVVDSVTAGTLYATLQGTGGLDIVNISSAGTYKVLCETGDSNAQITLGASADFVGSVSSVSLKELKNCGAISGATWTHGIGTPVAQTAVIDWNKGDYLNAGGTITEILVPQGLTSGRDLLGNLFENVRKQGALNLDGNSWAEVHDNESLDITDAITLEAWVYWDTSDTIASGVFGKWTASNQCYLLYKTNAGDGIRFYINSNAVGAGSLTDGWHHIVGTYDRTNKRLYVDGAQVNLNNQADAIATSSLPLEIGRYDQQSSYGYEDPIAQPRIYNRALTAEEVQRSYDSNKNIYTNS